MPSRRLSAAGAHLGADFLQRFVPGDALPFAFAPFADALERVEDALRIVNLVVGGRAFGAVAAAAAGMGGVALKFLDLQAGLVHVGEQAAGAFAVEADGGHERVAAGHFLGPRFAVPLDPVVPMFRRRVFGKTAVFLFHGDQFDIGDVDLRELGQRLPGGIRFSLRMGGKGRVAHAGTEHGLEDVADASWVFLGHSSLLFGFQRSAVSS